MVRAIFHRARRRVRSDVGVHIEMDVAPTLRGRAGQRRIHMNVFGAELPGTHHHRLGWYLLYSRPVCRGRPRDPNYPGHKNGFAWDDLVEERQWVRM